MKSQLNARLSDSSREKLDYLTRRYGTQTTALELAIDRLYRTERGARKMSQFNDGDYQLEATNAIIEHLPADGELVEGDVNWPEFFGSDHKYVTVTIHGGNFNYSVDVDVETLTVIEIRRDDGMTVNLLD